MNLQDFFRSFMGIHPRYDGSGRRSDDPVNKFKNPPWGDDPDEDDDFDELYNDYRGDSGRNDFGFNIFSGDAMQIHRFFEQQMNEMMKSFGTFSMAPFDFALEDKMIDREQENSSRTENGELRDRYLKTPSTSDPQPSYSNSLAKKDSDLDNRIRRDGIGALFKKEEEGDERRPSMAPARPPSTFSRSFTSRVIVNQDGRVEERVREWKSDGSERETVRRRLGDESHSVTTTTEPSGEIRQQEELINIDQDSLSAFNQKWSGRDSPNKAIAPNGTKQTEPSAPGGGLLSSLWSLFS